MANAITYLGNVGKSIAYSTIDEVKNLNPALTSFMDNNSDVAKSAYSSIKNLKLTAKQLSSKVMESDYAELGKDLLSNIKDDIKSGNFYNKERQDKAEQAAADAFMDISEFDIDDGSMDDIDLDSSDSGSSNIMDSVGERSSKAMANIMVGTSEYMVASMHSDNKAMYDQNKALYLTMHSGMKTINQNIGGIVEFMSGPMQKHLENSQIYFDASTKLQSEQTEILREIRDLYKSQVQPEKTKSGSRKTTMNDILDSEGMPNLETYFGAIKENINDMTSGTMDMITTMFNKDTLSAIIASPMKVITDTLVKQVIPSTLKGAMKDINKSLSGLFASGMANLNNIDEISNPILGFIKSIFGVKPNQKTDFDTGKFTKDAIPFDGVTKHSIVTVIPTYLAEILEAVGGKGSRYDYETGKIVTKKEIKDKKSQMEKSAMDTANMDISPYLNAYKNKLKFKDDKEKDQFEQDLQAILSKSFKDGKLFNHRAGGNAASYGLKGGKASDVNLELVRAMFAKMPKSVQLQWANNMFMAKDQMASRMSNAETSGYDTLAAMYNGSMNLAAGDKPATGTSDSSTGAAQKKTKGNKARRAQSNAKKASQDVNSSKLDALQARAKFESDLEDVNNDDLYGFGSDGVKESITDKIMSANKISDKAKLLYKNINEIMHKPTDMLAGLIKKADQSIYDLIFGREKTDKDVDKGIASVIIDKLKESFENAKKWFDDTIAVPISKFLNKNLFDKVGRQMAQALGLDYDNLGKNIHDKFFGNKEAGTDGMFGPTTKRMGAEFGRAGKFVKSSFQDANDTIGFTKKMNEAGAAKKDKKDTIDKVLSAIGVGSIDNAAGGMKRVTKTGVVAVSEGEMIVPPDKNPNNIKSRLKKENDAKTNYINYFGIPSYGGGTEGQTIGEDIKDQFNVIGEKVKQFRPTTFAKHLMSGKKTKKDFEALSPEDQNKVVKALNAQRSNLSKEDYEDGRDEGLMSKSLGVLKDGAINVYNEINRFVKDKDGKDVDSKKENKAIEDSIAGQIQKFLPEMGSGALIGTGISMATGLIGGPLVGAALGAATSLITHSDAVQDMLFGKKVTDEDGNTTREGSNLVSKDLANNIEKYLPGMSKGATVGAITSMLPFIPGGPVAGMILGAGAGFALKSEKVHEAIFGKDKLLEGFDEKVKKALPKMGAGALVGLVAGPFSLVPNLILGSAVGFATSTDKFQDILYGKADKDGNRTGGLIKKATDLAIKPIIDFSKNQIGKLGEWAEKNIKDPLAKAVDPLKNQVKLMFSSIGEHIKKATDKFFVDHLGAPIDKFIKDKLFGPISKVFKKILGGGGKMLGGIISSPFKAIGAVGNRFRTKDVNNGTADYMTAEQRRIYRDSKDFKRGGFTTNKKQIDIDTTLEGMDAKSAGELANRIDNIYKAEKEMKTSNADAREAYKNDVQYNDKLTAGDVDKIGKQIEKAIKKNVKDPKKVSKEVTRIINSLDLPEVDRNKIWEACKNLIASERDKAERTQQLKSDKEEAFGAISDEFDIDNLDDKEVKRLVKYLRTEEKVKSKKAKELVDGKDTSDTDKQVSALPELNANQQERHVETIDKLDSIYNAILKMANPDKENIDGLSEDLQMVWDDESGKYISRAEVKRKRKERKTAKKDKKKKDAEEQKKQEDEKNNYMDVSAAKAAREKYGESDKESLIDELANKFEGVLNKIKGGGNDLDPNDSKTVTQLSPFGGIIRLRKNKDGEMDPDTSDSDTKETIKEQSSFKSAIGVLPALGTGIAGITGMFSKFGAKLFGDKEKGEDGFLSGIFNFLTGGVSGSVKDILSKVSLGSVFSGIIGPALLVGGFTGAFDDLGSCIGNLPIFKGNDTESPIDNNEVTLIDGKQLATDENGKFIQNENGEYQTTQGDYVSGNMQAVGEDTSVSAQLKKNLVTGAVTGGGSVASTVVKGAAKTWNKVTGGAVTKVGKAAVKAGDKVIDAAPTALKRGVMSSVAKALENIPKVLKSIPFIPDSVVNGADTIVTAIYTHVRYALKGAGSKLAKVGGLKGVAEKLSKAAAALRIIYVVGAGINAWGNAESILGITDDATTTQKVIAVLIAVTNALIPIIGDLIPNKVLVNIFMTIAPKLGLDVSSLEEQRKAANEEVAAYNEEHGTELSIEAYNEMNGKAGILTKAGNGVKSLIANVKEQGLGKTVSNAAGAVGDYVSDKVSVFKQGMEEGGLGEAVASTLDSILPGPLGDIAGNTVRIKDMAIKGDISGVLKAKLIDTADGEKENMMTKLVNTILGTIVKIPNIPIAVVSKGVHFVTDAIGGIFTNIKGYATNTISNIKAVHDDTISMINDPDSSLGDFFNFSKYEDEDGNPLSGITKGMMVGTRLVTFGAKLVGAIGKRIGTWVGGKISAVKDNVLNVAKNHVTLMAKAAQGDLSGIWTYSADDNEDSPVNGFVKGTLFASKLMTTIPAILVNVGKKVADGAIKLGTTVKSNVSNVAENHVTLMAKAVQGDLSGIWSYSADDNEDSPVNGFVKGTLFASKLLTTIPAIIFKVGNKVAETASNIAGVVKANAITVGVNALNVKALSDEGDIGGLWSYESQDTPESPVNGFVKFMTFGSKLAFTIPTLFHAAGNAISNWITPKIEAAKKNQSVTDKIGADFEKYADDGDVSSIWSYQNKTSLDTNDVLTPFRYAQLGFQKIFYSVVGIANKIFGGIASVVEGVKGKVDTVKDALGDTILDIGETLFGGLKDIITGSGSDVLDRVKNYVGSGSDDGSFISQLDSKYANKQFNVAGDTSKQTLGDTGCGPATAAMVINKVNNAKKVTMDQAAADARKYKMQNSGVTADYFGNEFTKNGLQTRYITDKDSKKRTNSIVQHLQNGHQVVLMGQDSSNTTKKNSPYGPNAHYIVANKISDNGKYIWVNDPESNKPNVRYDASKLLGSTQMGVAGYAASGSKISSIMDNIHGKVGGRGITLVGSCTNEQIFNYFIDLGFTAEAAAAAVGNLCQEGGMDSSGNVKINSTESNGEGVGIVQWSKSRKTSFIDFASQNGDPWPGTSLGTQLAFLTTEIEGGNWSWPSSYGYDSKYNISFDDFKTSTDIDKATGAWCAKFERCKYVNSHLNDVRTPKAYEVYNAYSGKHKAAPENVSSTSGASVTADSSSSGNVITDALSALSIFDKLGEAWGLSTSSDSSNESSDTTSTGNDTTSVLTSGGTAEQNALVDKMRSVQNQIAYSTEGPRDPDKGSADCSSTVEWAYNKILGVDPGSTTIAMATDDDLTTVTTSLDPSKFKPGDILLYNKSGTNTIGHVEMYAGNNQTIGHGGGKNGTTKGPTIKDDVKSYRAGDFAMARRWTGFDAASGSGLNPSTMRGPKSVLSYKSANGSGIVSPSKFYAAGSGLGTALDTKQYISKDIQLNSKSVEPKLSGSTGDSKYLVAMISLLNKISSNTSNISSIVEILTKLAELEAKTSEIDTSTEAGKQKSKELNSSKKLLLASLKNSASQSSNDDGSMDELIKSVDAIIKM